MPMPPTERHTAAGVGIGGGHGRKVEAAPAAASPERSARPRRWVLIGQNEPRIPADIDHAADTRWIGAIRRRKGLSHPAGTAWRRQRNAGAVGTPVPHMCERKTAGPNALAAELRLVRQDNARLTPAPGDREP
jgi:transposase